MQPLNNTDEENRKLLMALELYRLQSVRNMLLVVLMAQLVLIGIGVTLVLQGNSLTPALTRFSPSNSANIQGHDNDRRKQINPSTPFYRPPDNQPVATSTPTRKSRLVFVATT